MTIDQIRRAYAEQLRGGLRDSSDPVVEAFATVPRERFCGLPPWRVLDPAAFDQGYRTTGEDPSELYSDILVALDEARGINNGQPSFWMKCFHEIAPKLGERVIHLGCGTGYYSAILAELVGSAGRVLAVDIDHELVGRAQMALKAWLQVQIVAADGATLSFSRADVIVASAGTTHVPRAWTRALAHGGRLMLSVTSEFMVGAGRGAVFKITRLDEDAFAAKVISPVGIIHFKGARDDEINARIGAALLRGRDAIEAVKSLRLDSHQPDDTCWLHTFESCLSQNPPQIH